MSATDKLAEEIVCKLLQIAHQLRGQRNLFLADFELNDVRYAVLHAVESFDPAGCTQTTLANTLRLSESNICTLVERMRLDGFLYRHRPKTDRRKRLLFVTEKSRQLLTRIDTEHHRRMTKLLQAFPLEDQWQLMQILRRLHESLPNGLTNEILPERVVPQPHFLKQTVRPRETLH